MWQFSRPHTIIGTVLAVCVLYMLAVHASGRQNATLFIIVLAASLAVNLYIVGLNQITDVAIDRINKPFLPLAAGTMSSRTAVVLVGSTGALALALAASEGPYLFGMISTIFLIGTAYSLPPARLKRYLLFAAASIITARAIVGTLGSYLTYTVALAGRPDIPSYILLFTGVQFGFTVVIAVMKDIPDAEGDRAHNINTVVLALGPARTLLLCRIVLTAGYVVAAAVAVGTAGLDPVVLLTAHTAAVVALWARSLRLDSSDQQAVRSYYLFVWTLFYFEFGVFLAAGLLAGK